MEQINIIQLVEKNPITRLSKEYENSLVNKVKDRFSDTQQQMFLASFYCYLNYDSKKDFIINFDDVWKWTGFSRKDPAKRLLEKYFTPEIDFKIVFLRLEENNDEAENKTQKPAPPTCGAGFEDENKVKKSAPPTCGAKIETDNQGEKPAPPTSVADQNIKNEKNLGGAGLNKENIFLNIITFKKFCIKANTKKADEIHDYYIKLEELLQETINEQTNELRYQLGVKENDNTKLLEEKVKIEEEKAKLERKYVRKEKEIIEDGYNVVYLMTSEDGEKRREYTVGYAKDLNTRKDDYNDNKLHDFKVVYYITCRGIKCAKILESIILADIAPYRCKKGRDVFYLPDENDISLFINIFKYFEVKAKNWEDDDIFFPALSSEEVKAFKTNNNKKYKEQKIEGEKKFRELNKQSIQIIRKDYYERNYDKIAEKRKDYYEENKETFINNAIEYYEEHKEDILEKRKDYYVENKEEILEKRKDYYDENYKTKISVKRQEKKLCECGMVVASYTLNNHRKTDRHKLLLERKNNPEILNNKNLVICECGTSVNKSSLRKHMKSKSHKDQLRLKNESNESADTKINNDEDEECEDEECEDEDDEEVEIEI
jgi:MSV199 domain